MLKAYPGTYLAEKIKEPTSVNLGKTQSRHVIHGRIVDVGQERVNDAGGLMKPFLEVGDIVFFINYGSEEKYEEFEWDGKTYYSIVINDSRAYIKGEK